MRSAFRKCFVLDLKKIKDRTILDRVRGVIELVEAADSPDQIADLKKLSGAVTFYRIRIGEYRVGLTIVGDLVEFVRVSPRRDLYRFFP